MEWATGHDRLVYFVLVRKEDEQYLDQHSTRATGSLEQYIGAAPRQLLDSSLQPMLCADCKYHRTPEAGDATHRLGGTVASHYGPVMTSGPYYRDRPAEFGQAMNQYPYRASRNDRHVQYDNAKFPWIKAAWRYEIQEADPGEWDFAVFKVPSALGPGNYIIH